MDCLPDCEIGGYKKHIRDYIVTTEVVNTKFKGCSIDTRLLMPKGLGLTLSQYSILTFMLCVFVSTIKPF